MCRKCRLFKKHYEKLKERRDWLYKYFKEVYVPPEWMLEAEKKYYLVEFEGRKVSEWDLKELTILNEKIDIIERFYMKYLDCRKSNS